MKACVNARWYFCQVQDVLPKRRKITLDSGSYDDQMAELMSELGNCHYTMYHNFINVDQKIMYYQFQYINPIGKDTPDEEIITVLMDKTFCGRHKWIVQDLPPVCQILDVFPRLKKLSYVSYNGMVILLLTSQLKYEFLNIIKTDENIEVASPDNIFKEARKNWKLLQLKIRSYAKMEAQTSLSLKSALEKQAETLLKCKAICISLRHVQLHLRDN